MRYHRCQTEYMNTLIDEQFLKTPSTYKQGHEKVVAMCAIHIRVAHSVQSRTSRFD